MRNLVILVVTVAGIVLQSPDPEEVKAARELLGLARVRTVEVDFDFRELIAASVTGRASQETAGKGRFLYEWPNKYRIEERRAGRTAATQVQYVWLEDGAGFSTWAQLGGSRLRPNLTSARLAALRRGREQEAMVYLAALLLADAGFMKYRAAGSEVLVSGSHGGSVSLVLTSGRVAEVRFRQARVAKMIARPDGSSWETPSETQAVRMRLADLRSVENAMIPHRMRAEYEQGWREVSIVRLVLNEPIRPEVFARTPESRR